jgi:signal transduction histidine kinase
MKLNFPPIGASLNPQMQPRRNSALIYGLLLAVWALVVAWQVSEHVRVREAAKTDLRNRSQEIANTLSAVIRALRFRGTVVQDRLEPVLNLLVNGRTNALVKSSELISVTLLNTIGDPVVSVGDTNFDQKAFTQEGEHWGENSVVFVNPVEGASVAEGVTNNAIVMLPSSFRNMTNEMRGGERNFPRPEPTPDGPPPTNVFENASASGGPGGPPREGMESSPPPDDGGGRPHGGPRRPPWMRGMSEADFKTLAATHELHGLVLAMSTENYRAVCVRDLWLRFVIVFFAGMSAVGAGLALRNVSQTAELQIRLVRASEMNSHLKEMNLAAAGLAHETRNPLNIIRGMAQMISKQTGTPPETREKSSAIVDETDKVTAQLNEFINYSRPREVRRSKIALLSAVNEVVRTLTHDIEEKKLRVEPGGEPIVIEADDQLLRQVLFNLLINAIQAADTGGQIQILARRISATEASLEVRDDGPGVPPGRRQEIFKPYFTTNEKGTGLGLAVVQQIVLAHGWEIECLANEPRGAVFRITHLKPAV